MAREGGRARPSEFRSSVQIILCRALLLPSHSFICTPYYCMTSGFKHQVGGHVDSIQLSPLGSSSVMKPAAPTELAFYQDVGPQLDNRVQGEFIGEWTPAFYGTLTLQGRMDSNGELDRTADVRDEVGQVSRGLVAGRSQTARPVSQLTIGSHRR